MRSPLRFLVLGTLILSAVGISHAYLSPGNPTGYINDFAQVITPDVKNTLEQELSLFEASTTNQITVVTVKTIGNDETIESYATKLFEEWKIGSKEKDNGILFLIAVNDHKARIEVGYGLEGALPDSIANSILQNDVLPLFKINKMNEGIVLGVRDIEKATKNEYKSTGKVKSSSLITFIQNNLIFIVGFFVVIFQIIFRVLGRSKSWWLGGVLGGVVGSIIGLVIGSIFIGIVLSISLIFIGFIIDYFASKGGQSRGGSGFGGGIPWIFGGNGGGSSGISFGGFSGGSSGGGGASGKW